MTKLALVLALLAAYGVGFWTANRPQALDSLIARPKKQTKSKHAEKRHVSMALQPSPAGNFSEAMAAAGEPPPGAERKDKEDNVAFARLVQKCMHLEDDWSARNVAQKARKLYQLTDYETLKDGLTAQMAAMASRSLNWFGEATFAIDGDALTVHAYVMFHEPTSDAEVADPCWSLETRIQRAGEWKAAGWSGGCPASLSISPDKKPFVEQTLYVQPAMGGLISTILFPMDAQSADPLQVLPAVSGQWMDVPFKFNPISDAQLAENQRMDAELETRSPASEGK